MKKGIYLAIFSLLSFYTPNGYTDSSSTEIASATFSKELPSALYKIGVSTSDIGQMQISGTPPSTLIQTFTNYANDANNKSFSKLSTPERNSLILFAFKLQNQGLISNDTVQALMTAEKLRTGMPIAHIREIEDLAAQFRNNPNYVISAETVNMVGDACSYININPYAFADVLGTIMNPILNQNTVTVPPTTEQILINAAKTLTGLSQDQINNIQDISDNYQSTQQFQATPANVNDMNQLMETSYYPDSSYLLLPFIGADALVTAAAISYAYPETFDTATVNTYNTNVYRNPTVEAYNRDGVYPRYNNAWQNRGNAANTRAQGRSDAANTRAQDRGNAADTRAQDRGNAADTRAQDRDGAGPDRGGFQGGDRGGFGGGGGAQGGGGDRGGGRR